MTCNFQIESFLIFRFILRQGANPASFDRAGRAALHHACAAGLQALLDELLAAAAAAAEKGAPGQSESNEPGDKLAISEASILAPDRSGLAPIHWACRWGKLDCVRALCATQPDCLSVAVTAPSTSDDAAIASAVAAAVATAGVAEGDTALSVAVRAPDEGDAVDVAVYLCEEGGDDQVLFSLNSDNVFVAETCRIA